MDAAAWDERYAAAELVWTETANRFVTAELSELAPGRALDLACGEGRNAIWLAEQGWTVTAVDYAANGLAKGRQLADAGSVTVDWVHADATTWDPPAGVFDLVLIAYLQLPSPDREAMLSRARTALAPGGTFLLVAHDRSNLDGGYGGPKDDSVLCDADTIVAGLGDIDVLRAGTVERHVDTDDGPKVAIDTLVRAVAPR